MEFHVESVMLVILDDVTTKKLVVERYYGATDRPTGRAIR